MNQTLFDMLNPKREEEIINFLRKSSPDMAALMVNLLFGGNGIGVDRLVKILLKIEDVKILGEILNRADRVIAAEVVNTLYDEGEKSCTFSKNICFVEDLVMEGLDVETIGNIKPHLTASTLECIQQSKSDAIRRYLLP